MPRVTQLPSLTTPANDDVFHIADVSAATSKKITRSDFLKGTQLPANTVDGQAISAGSVTPDKKSGGFHLINHTFANATGTQTVSGVPFKPKAVLVDYGSGSSSAFAMSKGRAFDNNGSIVQSAEAWTQSSSSGGGASSTSNAIIRTDTSGTTNFRAQITSFNNDGITVNVGVTSATEAYRIFNLMFLG